MTITDIQNIISGDETRTLELKKSTGELKDGMHTACAFLNTDGGWLIFGIAPKSLKIIGQQVTDATRQEIALAITGLYPAINPNVEYIDIPDKPGYQVIAIHFDGWKMGDSPFTFHGCPYYKVESTTRLMPQDMYNDRLRESKPSIFAWENQTAYGVTMNDLSVSRIMNAVRGGINGGRVPASALQASPEEILSKFGLLKDGKLLNAAVMLFAEESPYYPQLLLRMARFKGDDKDEFIDNQRANGNFFDLLDAGMAFLFKHLNISGVIKGLQREEKLEIPQQALREAIINAMCHRKYDSPSASISIGIYNDRVEITNPGHLTHGLTVDTIKTRHESFPYNPLIAKILYKSTYLENWGSGIKRIIELCKSENIPEPKFEATDYTVTIIFQRPKVDDSPRIVNKPDETVNQTIIKLTDNQKKIIELIKANKFVTQEEMAEKVEISRRHIAMNIKALRDMNIIERIGGDKGGYWVVNQQ